MSVVMLQDAKGERVGGKAANLGELIRMKVQVPPGFVVDADEFDKHLIDVQSIENLLDSMRFSGLLTKVSKAYHDIGGGKVAVRSSAVGEDGKSLSFAGQHDTYLNMEGFEQVVAALIKCWASSSNDRAEEYRKSNNVNKASMAVVVQKMVDSEVSGVMFTADPTNVGDGSMIVVEAVWGLGEAIVSGTVTPDRYLVHKSEGLKEINVSAQDVELRNGDYTPVPEDRQIATKLTKAQITELAELGMKLEVEYGWPQDVEWAMTKGKMYIVQSRPITTLKKAVANAVVGVSGKVLAKGIGASGGVASGEGKLYSKDFEGGVLVTETTDPDYLPAMKKAVAIVTGKGGMTCHAAIVCRELGIPCIVGVGKIDHLIGLEITVHGDAGVVTTGPDITPTKVRKVVAKPGMKVNKPEASGSEKEIIESVVGPVEVIEPLSLSLSKKLEDGKYVGPYNTTWFIYHGKGYPFSDVDWTYKEFVKQCKIVPFSSLSYNPKELTLVEPAESLEQALTSGPKQLTDQDLELISAKPYGVKFTFPDGATWSVEIDYVTLKTIKWPEGPAEAKSMGGKYDPGTKTWKVLKDALGLEKLKYLKVIG